MSNTGAMPEQYASGSAVQIVEAIWDRWDKALASWDLESATVNQEARELAVRAVQAALDENPCEERRAT